MKDRVEPDTDTPTTMPEMIAALGRMAAAVAPPAHRVRVPCGLVVLSEAEARALLDLLDMLSDGDAASAFSGADAADWSDPAQSGLARLMRAACRRVPGEGAP